MRKLSLVVPVLNEAKKIDGLLRQLDVLPGSWEVIFVDGGSSDGTLERLQGRYPVARCPRGRAVQMNEGARRTSGEVLVFLHCDSSLPYDLCEQVEQVLDRGYAFGCFRIRFDSCHPLMKCCAICSNLRVRVRRIAFGDQGIFLTRRLFEEEGGFAPVPIMEDYELSLRLRGRYPLGQTRGYLVSSARRFEQDGILRTMWNMQVMQHRFRTGCTVQGLAQQYDDIR